MTSMLYDEAYWVGYLAEHLRGLTEAAERLSPLLDTHAATARAALDKFRQRNQLTLRLDDTADGCDGDGIPYSSGQATADSWRYDQ